MESVIELTEDDKLDRELLYLHSRYGNVPPSAATGDMQDQFEGVSEPRALLGLASSTSGMVCSGALPPSPADDDYDGQFDYQLQDGGAAALSHQESYHDLDDYRIGHPSQPDDGQALSQGSHAQSSTASRGGSVRSVASRAAARALPTSSSMYSSSSLSVYYRFEHVLITLYTSTLLPHLRSNLSSIYAVSHYCLRPSTHVWMLFATILITYRLSRHDLPYVSSMLL